MEFLSYVNIVQASKRIAFFLPLRFYSVVKMCICYSVYSVGSIGILQSSTFPFPCCLANSSWNSWNIHENMFYTSAYRFSGCLVLWFGIQNTLNPIYLCGLLENPSQGCSSWCICMHWFSFSIEKHQYC